ncbi:hypothetical protein Tco_1561712 [Tanacetum coccineum]
MACALVDVHGEELTLRVGDEKLTFNVESTSKYTHKHRDKSINQIVIIVTTCEEHFHEVLNVHKSIHPLSGSPTLSSDPVVASLFPSLTPFGDSDFLLEEIDAFLALDDSIPLEIDIGIYDSEGDILFLEKLLIDDPVPIPRVSEKPLDSLDPISKTFDMTITNPLFDFDFEFTLNSDNPIFDIQNEEHDESETETIMKEVQIHSSQSIIQIPPLYEKLNLDLTMSNPILTFSQFRYGIFRSHYVFDILGPRLLFSLSYCFGLVFPENFSKVHSLDLFNSGDENEVFDPGIIVTDVDLKF